MPRKTDSIKLGDAFLKRSAKLLPCQKEMVVWWHTNRGLSQRQLATLFHVSRGTIRFILDPDKLKRNLEARTARGGSKIYYDKSKHSAAIKEHRNYKKQLFKLNKMGHDINGFRPSDPKKPVAHVRIGGADRRKTSIYKALDAEKYNALDSGSGGKREFTEEQLLTGLKSISRNQYMQEEKEFIMDCLNNLEDGKIIIHFS